MGTQGWQVNETHLLREERKTRKLTHTAAKREVFFKKGELAVEHTWRLTRRKSDFKTRLNPGNLIISGKSNYSPRGSCAGREIFVVILR